MNFCFLLTTYHNSSKQWYILNKKLQMSSGLDMCDSCPAGYHCYFGKSFICPKGSFCPDGSGMNTSLCPPGTYNSMEGLSEVGYFKSMKWVRELGWDKISEKHIFATFTFSLYFRKINALTVMVDGTVNHMASSHLKLHVKKVIFVKR